MTLILALVAFAAGTIVQAAQTTVMDIEMSMAIPGDDEMGDCEGCPTGGDGQMDCSTPCTVPMAGIAVTADKFKSIQHRQDVRLSLFSYIVGREDSPDLQPPNFLF